MPFSVDDLAEHAGTTVGILDWLSSSLPTGEERLYDRRPFRKRNGGMREVFQSLPPFDAITKNLSRSFTSQLPYEAPSYVHGFIHGRSTVSNASQHLGKKCVLRVDLEDFFPSISAIMVKDSLQENGYEEKAAELAVSILTIAGKLPIGLSTSPFLSNLAFLKTDRSLAEYALSESLSFTRYVDDLTFSGDVANRHRDDIYEILDDAGWSVNTRKTVFMRRGGPQYVTGLYVGEPDRPRIPPKIKRRMRWILHIITKFGYDIYMEEFHGEDEEMHRRRLLGWACYVAAVEPELGRPMLRAFNDLIPEGRGGTLDWSYREKGRIRPVTYVEATGQPVPTPAREVVDLAHRGMKIQALYHYRQSNPGVSLRQSVDVINEILASKLSL